MVFKTNSGQKYCIMLQGKHSEILLTFIKLPFVIKTFVLSILRGRFTQLLLYVPSCGHSRYDCTKAFSYIVKCSKYTNSFYRTTPVSSINTHISSKISKETKYASNPECGPFVFLKYLRVCGDHTFSKCLGSHPRKHWRGKSIFPK